MSDLAKRNPGILADFTQGTVLEEPFVPMQSYTARVMINRMEGIFLQAAQSPDPAKFLPWVQQSIGHANAKLGGDIVTISNAMREQGTIDADSPANPQEALKQLNVLAAANVRLYLSDPGKFSKQIQHAISSAERAGYHLPAHAISFAKDQSHLPGSLGSAVEKLQRRLQGGSNNAGGGMPGI